MNESHQITKTTEAVRKHALYVTECCNVEMLFKKGETFTRCPQCEGLALWQLVQLTRTRARAA